MSGEPYYRDDAVTLWHGDCREVTEWLAADVLVTADWLTRHVGVAGPLYMRAAGDGRKDSIVKRELFDRHIRDAYDVRYVLDDRQQVVDMWRALGLTVFQVAKGDF